MAAMAHSRRATVWLWVSAGSAERNAISSLPEPERRALYRRTLDTLASTCDLTKRPSGLENFCREQAELIRQFPECDEACTAFWKDHLPAPTR
jgi:hypothetical protein